MNKFLLSYTLKKRPFRMNGRFFPRTGLESVEGSPRGRYILVLRRQMSRFETINGSYCY